MGIFDQFSKGNQDVGNLQISTDPTTLAQQQSADKDSGLSKAQMQGIAETKKTPSADQTAGNSPEQLDEGRRGKPMTWKDLVSGVPRDFVDGRIVYRYDEYKLPTHTNRYRATPARDASVDPFIQQRKIAADTSRDPIQPFQEASSLGEPTSKQQTASGDQPKLLTLDDLSEEARSQVNEAALIATKALLPDRNSEKKQAEFSQKSPEAQRAEIDRAHAVAKLENQARNGGSRDR